MADHLTRDHLKLRADTNPVLLMVTHKIFDAVTYDGLLLAFEMAGLLIKIASVVVTGYICRSWRLADGALNFLGVTTWLVVLLSSSAVIGAQTTPAS